MSDADRLEEDRRKEVLLRGSGSDADRLEEDRRKEVLFPEDRGGGMLEIHQRILVEEGWIPLGSGKVLLEEE